MSVSTCLSLITLNVNVLNCPKDKVVKWIKQDTFIYCLQGTYFKRIDMVKEWEKQIFDPNGNKKKAGEAISYQTKCT